MDKEISAYIKEVFGHIAEEYELAIDTMEVMEDHVHIFVEAPPKYSPAQVVQIMKSISARETFKKFPKLRKQLWAGELWNDGYFVSSVGDRVTADIIVNILSFKLMKITPANYACSITPKMPSSLLGGNSLIS